MPREILIHLNVTPAEGDQRSADEIADRILAALEVGLEGEETGSLASGSSLALGTDGASIIVALAEEI